MSIEGQGHFFTIYFPGFVCFVLYWAKISGERLQDHWSSGYIVKLGFTMVYIIFLFFLLNTYCGYLLEPPHWAPPHWAILTCTHNICFEQKYEKIVKKN